MFSHFIHFCKGACTASVVYWQHSKVNATGAVGTVQLRVKRAIRQLTKLWDGLGNRNLSEAWLGGVGVVCLINPHPSLMGKTHQNVYFSYFFRHVLNLASTATMLDSTEKESKSGVDNSEAPRTLKGTF